MVTGVGTMIQPTSAGVITSTTSMGATTVIQGMTPASTVESTIPQRRASDNRRSNKPIMEKRRRARINNCLNDLKTLILEAMKKDPARHSKLEKADILEMTVKHLENLQRQQAAMSAAADPSVINKFRAGFSECLTEVGRFPGLDSTVKRRLLQHLANCLQVGANTILTTPQQTQQTTKEPTNISAAQSTTVTVQPSSVQLHILPQAEPQNGIFFTNGNGTGVQLVPTRLPNGDIALILPTSITPATPQQRQPQYSPPQNRSTNTSPVSPLPLLIPIPAQQRVNNGAYVIHSVQSSIPSPQDRPSSSTSTMSNASSLQGSPVRQGSPIYSMPGSPYEIMEPSITSSQQSRKSPPVSVLNMARQASPYSRPDVPLSLVIRKAPSSPASYQQQHQQNPNEKPWRPW